MRYFDWRWLLVGIVLVAACEPELRVSQHQNLPPHVWLSSGPPEGSVGTYSVQLYWGGWDPDGEILRYEYLVTDNVTGVFSPRDTVGVPWNPVLANDATFTFSADSLMEDPISQKALFMRSHTFFIRAVDEQGLRSLEPVRRSFTSRTISPIVNVTTPNDDLGLTPAAMPPISTFVWNAIDYIDGDDSKQDPDSVQWALVSTKEHGNEYGPTIEYLRNNPHAPDWRPWVWYRAPLDSGKSWTTPPLEFGDYVFAVRAKDEAGAVTPILEEPVNLRRIKIAPLVSGPTFLVQNVFIGRVIASSCNFPVTIADIAAGVPISFALSACAKHYGGTVSGYRYGWDIIDLSNPDDWEIDYTPFVGTFAVTPPRSFDFGTRIFTAEVIDNSGYCSRIEVKVNFVRFTGERNLIIVDDYSADERPGAGWIASRGGLPNDAEHDAFWLDMVSNLNGFDATRDMIATTVDREIPLTTLAGYKSIFWSVYGAVNTSELSDLPSLYTYIQYRSKNPASNPEGACGATPAGGGKVLPNALALAMQAGVHVLIAGQHPVQNVMPRGTNNTALRWPMISLYELEPGATQTGSSPTFQLERPGDLGFAYRELCLDAIDYAFLTTQRARTAGGTGANSRYCPINGWRNPGNSLATLRDHTMRAGNPLDPNFLRIELRAEAAGTTSSHYHENKQGIDAEMYNPEYFRIGAACAFVPEPRDCFESIYGLVCLDTEERSFDQPVAFWTGAFADVVSQDIPGAVAARSIVFGFPPVYFEPLQVKSGIEYILFDEWQLPRRPATASR